MKGGDMLLFTAGTMPYSDKEKLKILYDTYSTRMFSAAKRITKNTADAEDAVQNAFVSISGHLPKIDMLDEDALKGYLLTIAKNEAVNVLRQSEKAESLDEAPPASDPFADVDARVWSREVYEKIISILRTMDDRYRAPLYLTCVMGYTVKETASQLHRNEQTVKGQIVRGKKMIISQLKEAGYEF